MSTYDEIPPDDLDLKPPRGIPEEQYTKERVGFLLELRYEYDKHLKDAKSHKEAIKEDYGDINDEIVIWKLNSIELSDLRERVFKMQNALDIGLNILRRIEVIASDLKRQFPYAREVPHIYLILSDTRTDIRELESMSSSTGNAIFRIKDMGSKLI